MKNLEYKIEYFERAIKNLDEALQADIKHKHKVALVIKFFEIAYKMAKKTLFTAIAEMGFDERKPKELFNIAYRENLISSNEIWEEIRKDRNDTTHEYEQDRSEQIYNQIPIYVKEFELVLQKVKAIK